jgi:hypothetical protein
VDYLGPACLLLLVALLGTDCLLRGRAARRERRNRERLREREQRLHEQWRARDLPPGS